MISFTLPTKRPEQKPAELLTAQGRILGMTPVPLKVPAYKSTTLPRENLYLFQPKHGDRQIDPEPALRAVTSESLQL